MTESKPRPETIPTKYAYGRIVSEDIASPINVPDKQRSHMDGFAVKASDLKGASTRSPQALSLIGKISLTRTRKWKLGPSETIGVSTGGEIPAGADAVVPVEHTRQKANSVYFSQEVEKGTFCFPVGVDVQKGSLIIRAGNVVRAQDVGMLALLGIRYVPVFAKPRVTIIATGDELADAFATRDSGKVRESHSPILDNLITEIGGLVINREIVRDDIRLVSSAIKRALRASDIVLTLGGTSMGEGDTVEQALRKLSRKTLIVHGIRMDRGRVAGVAAIHGKPVVMLPGPVQGAMNAFFLLALPLISAMIGGEELGESVNASLSKGWEARKRFENFTKVLYVQMERRDGTFLATPMVGETESMRLLVQAAGFVTVPERIRRLRKGDEVSVRLLPGFSYSRGHSAFDRAARSF